MEAILLESKNWRKTNRLVQVASVKKPLSRKTINKLSQHISRFSEKSTDQLRLELQSIDFSEYSTQDYAKISVKLPFITSLLLKKEYGISNIDTTKDISEVIKALVAIILSNNKNNVITMVVGLGATTFLPSIRIASYLIPILKTLTCLKENDINLPKVRVFKASYTGIYANALSEEKVLEISKITLDILELFVQKFYPSLKDSFVFEQDGDLLTKANLKEIKHIENLLESLPFDSEAIISVGKMGKKHGGKNGQNNALFYAAAHPIFNKSIIPVIDGCKTISLRKNKCELVIDYGGRPQAMFNQVSNQIKHLLDENKYLFCPTLNIITTCGKVPVYYYAKKGDFNIGEKTKNFSLDKIDPLTRVDYEILFNEITRYDYLQFVNDFQETHLNINLK